jgi:transposase-like protein
MKSNCPNNCCSNIVKNGFFFRTSDSRKIQRYRCQLCRKQFSQATNSLCYLQKKRRVNELVFKLLASGVSMRRCALILNIHRTTVKRKLNFLARRARQNQKILLDSLKERPVSHLQFDDLITIEHTKLKPLSVSIAVDAKKRTILATEISQIPAFGHLAALSKKKYGFRESHHKEGLKRMFEKIKDIIASNSLIESDQHKLYPGFVREYFKCAHHKRYKGGRGCVAGQGELKKLHRDPLFTLNHTCAMFRANINRLIRKTWCTTKRPDMLQNHIDLYTDFHNRILIKQ